eukprot:scaffold19845_cov34-Attheya_sp.AAC.3
MARTMLIHGSNRWKGSITVNLWPYAVRMANDALNEVPSFQNAEHKTPKKIFANTRVFLNTKQWKPFGCPVYHVLDSAPQTGSIFHKWKQRSKVGIYIGRSPQHGRNVALVLGRTTCLVSPQFHVTYDPTFQSVQRHNAESVRHPSYVAHTHVECVYAKQRKPRMQHAMQ